MHVLNQYRKYIRAAENAVLIDGDREFVEKFISRNEFPQLFGGYFLASEADKPSAKPRFIGVWGSFLVRKFKRILRERGARFEVLSVDSESKIVRQLHTN
jgi:hypothetical protein